MLSECGFPKRLAVKSAEADSINDLAYSCKGCQRVGEWVAEELGAYRRAGVVEVDLIWICV